MKYCPNAFFRQIQGTAGLAARKPVWRANATVCVCAFLLLTMSAHSARGQELSPVSTICVEADTGLVLAESNADIRRPPASMVKLLQMLLVVEGVEAGSWDLQRQIYVSANAERMGGTQVALKQGEIWTLGELMQAVAVASANDAAMAVAEGLWGSEMDYLMAVNTRARQLGMLDTEIHSAHGLPPAPGEPFDQSTARDMARLGRECLKHPLIMYWVGQKEYRLRPTDPLKSNTNKLLWRMPDCDGMKTGFIRAAGFCITATAKRNGIRLVSVVMGCPSKYGRFNMAQGLLEAGFMQVKRERLVSAGAAVGPPIRIVNGNVPSLLPTVVEDVWVITTERDREGLDIIVKQPPFIDHPVAAGDIVGEIQVARSEEIIATSPLRAPIEVSDAPPRAVLARPRRR